MHNYCKLQIFNANTQDSIVSTMEVQYTDEFHAKVTKFMTDFENPRPLEDVGSHQLRNQEADQARDAKYHRLMPFRGSQLYKEELLKHMALKRNVKPK